MCSSAVQEKVHGRILVAAHRLQHVATPPLRPRCVGSASDRSAPHDEGEDEAEGGKGEGGGLEVHTA
jgi:hypothetical protein